NPTSPSMRKRQRTLDMHPGPANPADQHPPPPTGGQTVVDDAFINDHDAVDSGGEDDEDEDKPKTDKKAGRRKIKIEFIQDKSRRHITFSKRKAGIMKKAYELSTLTGTQVLLLVVSETGLVYTFTTAKLQPLVTQPEGKNLIQACLNAPHGTLPSSMPVGPPIGRSPMNIPSQPPPPSNLPGGLAIGNQPPGSLNKDDADDHDDDDAASHGGRPTAGDKRRRRASSTTGPPPASAGSRGQTSPHSPNASVPPPLNIPPGSQPGSQPHSSHPQPAPQSQIALGSPTSPQQQHPQVPASSQYSTTSYPHHPAAQPQQTHHQQHDAGMYGNHMMSPGGYSYPPGGTNAQGGPGQQQLGGLAAAAASHGHWGQAPQQPVGQSGHYGRR
ncbi:SRF-TF-domain-containing protein, partial [Coprinopsis marcescibilis]